MIKQYNQLVTELTTEYEKHNSRKALAIAARDQLKEQSFNWWQAESKVQFHEGHLKALTSAIVIVTVALVPPDQIKNLVKALEG